MQVGEWFRFFSPFSWLLSSVWGRIRESNPGDENFYPFEKKHSNVFFLKKTPSGPVVQPSDPTIAISNVRGFLPPQR